MRVTSISVRLLTCFYRTTFVLGLMLAQALPGQQSQFQGSVPTGTVSSTPLGLTLRDALDRGLRNNLGLLVSGWVAPTALGYAFVIAQAAVVGLFGELILHLYQSSPSLLGQSFS